MPCAPYMRSSASHARLYPRPTHAFIRAFIRALHVPHAHFVHALCTRLTRASRSHMRTLSAKI